MRAILQTRLMTMMGRSMASSRSISPPVIPRAVVVAFFESRDRDGLSPLIIQYFDPFNLQPGTDCGSVAERPRQQLAASGAMPEAAPEIAACGKHPDSARAVSLPALGIRRDPRYREERPIRPVPAARNLPPVSDVS